VSLIPYKRKGIEVTGIGDKKTTPDDINVINPAFDTIPPELISGIIAEKAWLNLHMKNPSKNYLKLAPDIQLSWWNG